MKTTQAIKQMPGQGGHLIIMATSRVENPEFYLYFISFVKTFASKKVFIRSWVGDHDQQGMLYSGNGRINIT